MPFTALDGAPPQARKLLAAGSQASSRGSAPPPGLFSGAYTEDDRGDAAEGSAAAPVQVVERERERDLRWFLLPAEAWGLLRGVEGAAGSGVGGGGGSSEAEALPPVSVIEPRRYALGLAAAAAAEAAPAAPAPAAPASAAPQPPAGQAADGGGSAASSGRSGGGPADSRKYPARPAGAADTGPGFLDPSALSALRPARAAAAAADGAAPAAAPPHAAAVRGDDDDDDEQDAAPRASANGHAASNGAAGRSGPPGDSPAASTSTSTSTASADGAAASGAKKKKGGAVVPPPKMMKQISKAIAVFDMIRPGDRLLLGLSGSHLRKISTLLVAFPSVNP